MQKLRTLIWVILTAVMVAFVAMNWETVTIRFWPQGDGDYLTFEAPGGLIAIVFYFFGLIPAWLYYRGVRWSMNRKIGQQAEKIQALENEKQAALAHAASAQDRDSHSGDDSAATTDDSSSQDA